MPQGISQWAARFPATINIKRKPVTRDVMIIFMIASIFPYRVYLVDARFSFFLISGQYKLEMMASFLSA
jgi:hypothetical protein